MPSHQRNFKIFAFLLIFVEALIIIMYGLFVRPQIHDDMSKNVAYYPLYQDVNVLILVGFGFLMTSIKNHQWSALAYTFFINSLVLQLYLLLKPFWTKVFAGDWGSKIQLVEMNLTQGLYSVASILISYGAVLGRIGPLELLIMGVVGVIAYTLNCQIIYSTLGVLDHGGSITIHTFGAYYGLTVSFILGKMVAPLKKPETDKNSKTLAMLGTFFIWMFWPSTNVGHFQNTPYERNIIIMNTIFALTGSCIGTFIINGLIRQKFLFDDIMCASLAGGVAIGSSSGILVNPAGALCIGIFGGIVSTLGFKYLKEKLQNWIGLNDSCGIHNLHGFPGILGGIFSAIIIASYSSDPLTDPTQAEYLPFYPAAGTNLNVHGRTFYQQGGIQIAAIFISMGIGIGFALLSGLLMKCFYAFNSSEFFHDHVYFQDAPELKTPNEIEINPTTDEKNAKMIEAKEIKINSI